MEDHLLGSVAVETDTELDPDRLAYASSLAKEKTGASVSVSSDHGLLDWSFRYTAANDPLEVAANALDAVRYVLHEVGVDDWTLARVAAISDEENRRQTRRTSPVVGMAEAADLLDRSRQRINQYLAEDRFPKPLAHLRSGPVWTRHDILEFARTMKGPGRPAGKSHRLAR